jgi:hypothetical protein
MSSSKNFPSTSRSATAGLILSAALAVTACGDAPKPVASSTPTTPAGGTAPAGGPMTPAGGGQTPGGAPAAVEIKDPVTDAKLAEMLTPEMKEMVEKVKKAQTAYDANKSDAKAKAALAAAKLTYGNALRDSEKLPFNIKYKAALKMYRQVLELDPQNKETIEKKTEIESIYKSMGRPIPE